MDVGNTTTVVGIFDGKKLTAHWRLSSILHTSDELGVYLLTLLGTKGVGDRKSHAELQSPANLVCRLLLEKKKNRR